MRYDEDEQCIECGETVADCDDMRRENYERREKDGKDKR